MSLETLVDQATKGLAQWTGREAAWIAVAPGRVNLIGEHVDYNDGFVLPLAIDRHVVLAASPREDRRCRFHSLNFDASFELSLDQTIARGEPAWSNYVRGVFAGFAERGIAMQGFDAVIVSDVPVGGGLSSSAALEVATATLIEAITGQSLDPVQKALLCQRAEHTFAGMPCGIMDQFASTLAKEGRLLLIDCRSQEVTHVPLSDPALGDQASEDHVLNEESLVVMVIDTGVQHELTDGGYAARRSQCEAAADRLGVKSLRNVTMAQLIAKRDSLTTLQWQRARHVVTEIARTLEAVDAIRTGDHVKLGDLMAASHASLRDDYEVSCDELDLVVATADAYRDEFPGKVVGSRMTGGGFGGCAVCLAKKTVADSLAMRIVETYELATGAKPHVFVTRLVQGARQWK